MAHSYRVFDQILESSVALPGLTAAAGAAEWRFELERSSATYPRAEWLRTVYTGTPSRRWLSVGRFEDRTLFRFHGTAVFDCRPGQSLIRCCAPACVSDDILVHQLLDKVIPYLFADLGATVLHASCVAGPDGAMLFVGPSGRGKSTLAAALAGRGWPLLSDDAALIRSGSGGARVVCHSGLLRLWEEDLARHGRLASAPRHQAGAGKMAVEVNRSGVAWAPLRRIFVLGPSTRAPRAEPLPGSVAASKLTRALFPPFTGGPAAVAHSVARLLDITGSIPCFDLRYPRSFDDLDSVCGFILEREN